jgi:hypothetical protein
MPCCAANWQWQQNDSRLTLRCLASQDGRTLLNAAASGSGDWRVVDRLIAARAIVDAADKVLPRTRLCRPYARTIDAFTRTNDERSTYAIRAQPCTRACVCLAAVPAAAKSERPGWVAAGD